MDVRQGMESDLPALVAMIEAKRREYEACEPVFWRRATDSAATTLPYFASLLAQGTVTVLVATEAERLLGFLIAMPVPTPPVYDPGGPTVLIDDFCVAEPSLWPTVGRRLLEHARQVGREVGWRQVVVVCGHADQPKSDLLRSTDLSLASTWWTAPV